MKPNFRILVIDDEKIVCDRLSNELEREGFEVEAYTESEQALQRIASQPFDLVITDIKMRGPNGIEVMNFVKENHPSTKVIVITGFAPWRRPARCSREAPLTSSPSPSR